MFVCECIIQYGSGYVGAGRHIDGLRDLSYVAVGVVKEAVAARGRSCLVCSCLCPLSSCLLSSWVWRVWSVWGGGSTRPSSMSLSLIREGVVAREERLSSTDTLGMH